MERRRSSSNRRGSNNNNNNAATLSPVTSDTTDDPHPGLEEMDMSNDSASRGSASTSRRARRFTERMKYLSRSRSSTGGSATGGAAGMMVSHSNSATSPHSHSSYLSTDNSSYHDGDDDDSSPADSNNRDYHHEDYYSPSSTYGSGTRSGTFSGSPGDVTMSGSGSLFTTNYDGDEDDDGSSTVMASPASDASSPRARTTGDNKALPDYHARQQQQQQQLEELCAPSLPSSPERAAEEQQQQASAAADAYSEPGQIPMTSPRQRQQQPNTPTNNPQPSPPPTPHSQVTPKTGPAHLSVPSFTSTVTADSKLGRSETPIANNVTRRIATTPTSTNRPSRPQRRTRVPGAAKLMLVGPHQTDEDESTIGPSTSPRGLQAVTSQETTFPDEDNIREIDRQMQQTKLEFETGSNDNRRYHPPAAEQQQQLSTQDAIPEHEAVDDDDDEAQDEFAGASPSFLNRSEIFPENPAAAVLALVTPRHGGDHRSVMTDAESVLESVPSSPSRSGKNNATAAAAGTGADSSESPLKQRGMSQPLLSEHAQRALEHIKHKLKNPNKTLTDLLTAIATPDDKADMDLGYMVRRKNACGALHVLTTQPKNRRPIGWTVGVFPALASVLEDVQEEGIMATFPDKRIRSEYLEARHRAIAALLNLCQPKENRMLAFHTTGLVNALLEVILEDDTHIDYHKNKNRDDDDDDDDDGSGPDLRGCTAILGFLVKTPQNRLLMAHVPGFMDAIAKVLLPKPPQVRPVEAPRKVVYPWSNDSDDSDDDDEVDGNKSFGKTPQSSYNTKSSKNTTTTTDDEDNDSGVKQQHSSSEDNATTDFEGTDGEGTDGGETYPGTDGEKTSYEEDDDDDDDDGTSPSSKASPRQAGKKKRGSGPGNDDDNEEEAYDGSASKFLRMSRTNLFAVLLHMIKEKDNAYLFARDDTFVTTVVEICKHQYSPSHTLAVKLLANLTRHRLNTKVLVFQKRIVVPALVASTESPDAEARRFACHGLQNIAQDKSCRQELATTKNLIEALCDRARQATVVEERLAAVSALKNLCDEPANLIPMTNSPDCISTLMHVAHGKEEGVTPMMRYRACDALATLSHWLRKIATSGLSLEATRAGKPAPQGLCVPSLRVVSWNQWQ